MYWQDAGAAMDVETLRTVYAYPSTEWVRTNFVSSVDGAITVDGRSEGLGSDADQLVFRLLRALADVVIVGAGTVRAENYGGVQLSEDVRASRRAEGRAEIPPIAIITHGRRIDPQARIFTEAAQPPIVITPTDTDPATVRSYRDAGARVLSVGEGRVDLSAAVPAIIEATGPRVLCEGGPTLHGELLTADLVDELCLTVSPQLVGPDNGSILPVALPQPLPLTLCSAVHSENVLLLRYRTKRGVHRG